LTVLDKDISKDPSTGSHLCLGRHSTLGQAKAGFRPRDIVVARTLEVGGECKTSTNVLGTL
jgi:hypothetical protein